GPGILPAPLLHIEPPITPQPSWSLDRDPERELVDPEHSTCVPAGHAENLLQPPETSLASENRSRTSPAEVMRTVRFTIELIRSRELGCWDRGRQAVERR
ncbi:hypothetical protein, partial [Kocuria rosea]|uniref:hypothetical protein n=1 Tax=Kocuria rosea TaxID=1275 RepID=UPI002B252198